jgi:hypothetical protein
VDFKLTGSLLRGYYGTLNWYNNEAKKSSNQAFMAGKMIRKRNFAAKLALNP